MGGIARTLSNCLTFLFLVVIVAHPTHPLLHCPPGRPLPHPDYRACIKTSAKQCELLTSTVVNYRCMWSYLSFFRAFCGHSCRNTVSSLIWPFLSFFSAGGQGSEASVETIYNFQSHGGETELVLLSTTGRQRPGAMNCFCAKVPHQPINNTRHHVGLFKDYSKQTAISSCRGQGKCCHKSLGTRNFEATADMNADQP